MNTAAIPAAAAGPEVKELPFDPIHENYFTGIFPKTPVVCGLRLKPLSIGRYRWMAHYGVAFVAEKEVHTSTAADLLKGVLICSMDCRAFEIFIEDAGFRDNIQPWMRKAGFYPPRWYSWPFIGKWLEKWFGAAIDRADAVYLTEQAAIFQKYIQDGSPDISRLFWSEQNDGGMSSTHWSQNIEAVLREYQGWTKEEIDEQPLTKALWDFYKHLENRGIGRFMTAEERDDLTRPLTPEEVAETEKAVIQLREYLQARKKAETGETNA